MSKLIPVNGTIILQQLEDNEESTHGNIVLPHLDHQDTVPCKVIAAADKYNWQTGEWITSWIKEGDVIMLNKMGGQRIYIGQEEYLMAGLESILAKLTTN